TVAADCASSLPINDADNYECAAGACLYKGCNSTKECTDTYHSLDYVCAQLPVYPFNGCVKTCKGPADCVGALPIADEDNFDCTAGHCEYKGCNSDAECKDTYKSPNYVCAALPGLPYKDCVKTCSAVADCTVNLPIADDDNFACDAGRCIYKGCNSTKECTDA